uniref:Small ribosomal subunit protein mS26 n=1 Tax=Lynceus sp. MCZ IZ 141354 TaxID=1930659 RepID=A0A9N6WRP3_9CRUS|nr:EOG090X0FQ9 [Lynceus sp. MCZ IZ 141354]
MEFLKLLSTRTPSTTIVRNVLVWKRKPMHLPTAKSKLFRITQRIRRPDDERAETKRIIDNYNTQMKSIRLHFYKELLKKADTGEEGILQAKKDEEEHLRLLEENRIENEKAAQRREARLEAARQALQEKVIKTLSTKEAEEKQIIEKLEAIVREKKEMVATMIARENVEQAIEEALANPIDFDFAIDQNGYVYRGKETRLSEIPEDKRERL